MEVGGINFNGLHMLLSMCWSLHVGLRCIQTEFYAYDACCHNRTTETGAVSRNNKNNRTTTLVTGSTLKKKQLSDNEIGYKGGKTEKRH